MKEMMDLVTAGKAEPVPDHPAQARRGRRDAPGPAQGPDHGTRRAGSVSQGLCRRALAHAFETGALAEQRAFFLRAEDPPFADITCEQSSRPGLPEAQAGDAADRGWRVATRARAADQAQGRELRQHRARLERCSSRAARWSAPAPTTMARRASRSRSSKALGLDDYAVEVPLPRVLARPKATTSRPPIGAASPGCSRWATAPGSASPASSPGIASTTARPCSRSHLPDDLAGHIADFGCGWGYLARLMLQPRRHAAST